MKSAARFDAPFWGVLVSAVVLIGALSCISIAALAHDETQPVMEVLTSDDLPPGGPAALAASAN